MKKTAFIICLLFCLVSSLTAQTRPDALREYRQGNYNRAIEICRMELEDTPGNMDSYTVMGWSLIRLERYQEALDSSRQGLSHNRHDVRLLHIQGEANFYLGNNQAALKNFEEYCVLAPTGDRIDLAYFYMGEIFIRLGEYNHADIALTTAVYHTSNIARWWSRLGYAREMVQDYRYAMEAYDKALQLSPSFTDALRGKERVQQKMAAG